MNNPPKLVLLVKMKHDTIVTMPMETAGNVLANVDNNIASDHVTNNSNDDIHPKKY